MTSSVLESIKLATSLLPKKSRNEKSLGRTNKLSDIHKFANPTSLFLLLSPFARPDFLTARVFLHFEISLKIDLWQVQKAYKWKEILGYMLLSSVEARATNSNSYHFISRPLSQAVVWTGYHFEARVLDSGSKGNKWTKKGFVKERSGVLCLDMDTIDTIPY